MEVLTLWARDSFLQIEEHKRWGVKEKGKKGKNKNLFNLGNTEGMIQRVVEGEGGSSADVLEPCTDAMNVSFHTDKSMFMCRQCVQKWENVFFRLMEDFWPWTIVLPAQKNDIFPERSWSNKGSTLSPNTFLFSWFLVSLNIVPDSRERLSIVQPL